MRADGLSDKAAELKQTYHEQADGSVVVNNSQDVEGHLKYAADMRRAEREEVGRFGRMGDFHHKMSVPFNILMMVAKRLGIPAGKALDPEYSKRIYQELKKPEFALFRTTERRI